MPSPSRRGEGDAERLEIRCDAGGQHPDLAHVADEAGMEVAAEELAERGLVAACRALAPELPDLLDVGAVKAHVLVSAEREDAPQGPVQRPDRKVFHLAPF